MPIDHYPPVPREPRIPLNKTRNLVAIPDFILEN